MLLIKKIISRSTITLILFFFSIFYSLSSVFSQSNKINISGYIVDSISQKKIPNVNIVLIENSHGTISNEKGYFNITAQTPIRIEFSVLGFKHKILEFDCKNDTSIILQMTPIAYDLNEISINGDNATYNYALNKFSVLDYNFVDKNVLILQKQRKLGGDVSLVLLNDKFDTISFKNNLPKSSVKIYNDCLGSFHLITRESAYQIKIDSSGISFYKPYDLNRFKQLLDNCLFRQGKNIFFIKKINRGFGHEIIYVNEIDKEAKLLIRYNDNENLTKLEDNTKEISKYYFLHSAVNASTNDSATVKHIHRFNQEYKYLSEIENCPIRNTISIVNDTIIYFNYYKSKLQLFTKLDELPIDINIDNNKTGGWGLDIKKDETKNALYSIKVEKSFQKIFAINYNKGTLEYITKLSRFNYEEIKINNGYIYYLNNPSSSRYHIRKLSRIKI